MLVDIFDDYNHEFFFSSLTSSSNLSFEVLGYVIAS